jgi:hypothetical protein
VPGLIEERRRYEGWITALDARRDTTPAHVFERVQTDYRARLQRVVEQLASHRQAIEEEQASVQSRVSLLEAEERLQRDERAELELRSHVGELMGDDAEGAFRTVDETIAQLVSEKQGLESRIAELQTLLDEGAPTPAPSQAAVASVSSVAATSSHETHTNEPPPPAAASVTSSEGEPPEEPVAAAASSSPAEGATESAQAAPKRGMSGSFDELAFLSSVVGKDKTPPMVEKRSSEPLLRASDNLERDEPVAESLLAGVDKTRHKTGEHPLAANVPANTPIVLKPTGTMEQSKTLKCNECGAMNYPTEWYCERCGAELAAL